MLVLSRKPGERIVIGDGIEVMVLEVRGDRVRLGFTAPKDVAIHRQEVAARIEREQEAANKLAQLRLSKPLELPGKDKDRFVAETRTHNRAASA